MKYLLLVIASVGALIAVYLDQPPVVKKTSAPVESLEKPLFNTDAVIKMKWTLNDSYLDTEKAGGFWKIKSTKGFREKILDPWETQRHLAVLSLFKVRSDVLVSQPLGEVDLVTNSKERIHGVYDKKAFQWMSGPGAGKGAIFSSELRDLFGEGLAGFESHDLQVCTQERATRVAFSDWAVERQGPNWFIFQKEKRELARPHAAGDFIEELCHVKVDAFVEDFKDSHLVLTVVEKPVKRTELKTNGSFFFIEGWPPFKSQKLEKILMGIAPAVLKDPTSDETSVALDPKRTTPERLTAIRKLRGNSSPEAMAALRALVFEKTEIDVYRYEAVDALAETGTKEAYQMITERLSQVGRSGFELRLARALAAAMGRFFNADEKTPEETRRPQVDELIQAARANPPGK